MDLFGYMREGDMRRESPLASRFRLKTLDEAVGQRHIVGKGKLLYRAIQVDKLGSIIFYRPPETGRATLVRVIANITSTDFRRVNATAAGKRGMEGVVKETKDNTGIYGRRTVLFVDEIHRFNKGQQDYPLLSIEDGMPILIGAATGNPYFEVDGVLLSRSGIFELKSLRRGNVKELIQRAVYDKKRGMGIYDAEIDEDATDFLADTINGDARVALNAMGLGALTTAKRPDGRIYIDMVVVQECIQKRAVRHDKSGDSRYDTTPASIKNIQGSDPDAAVCYLARMLYTGEDIKFIARRIMICAAGDMGNADPQALVVAVSAAQAAERIGFPEANIILLQTVTYVATAPKSNVAYMTVQKAMGAVRNERTTPVPVHLQDKCYKGAGKLGHGAGYRYAHDYLRHYVQQQYLPDDMGGTVFHGPSDNDYEKQISAHMKQLKS